jgi:hypothetical protein
VHKQDDAPPLRPKMVPTSPGVILKPEDAPKVPEHRSNIGTFVAMLQFPAKWVQMDIFCTISQLARLYLRCLAMGGAAPPHGIFGVAFGGPNGGAVPPIQMMVQHSPLENLEGNQASRSHIHGALQHLICCLAVQIRIGAIALPDNQSQACFAVQQIVDSMEIQDAEDFGFLDWRQKQYYSASTAATELLYL